MVRVQFLRLVNIACSANFNARSEIQKNQLLHHFRVNKYLSTMLHLLFFLALVYAGIAQAKIKPPFWQKAETARWLAHRNLWGTLSTTSVHLHGQAWGQPKSFVDGSNSNSTGVLYFYDSDMDASMEDVNANPNVAFSLSSAQVFGLCPVDRLDPENPSCARVVMSGQFIAVTDEDELSFAQTALFERHPEMVTWPEDHSWKVHKIDLNEIWLIDIYGGAAIVEVEDYYAVDMNGVKDLA